MCTLGPSCVKKGTAQSFRLANIARIFINLSWYDISVVSAEVKAESSLFTKVLRTQLVESTKEIEVQQKDPNSPLYSVKTFEELNMYVAAQTSLYSPRICSIIARCSTSVDLVYS